MDWANLASVAATILGSAGVLLGGVHWAVSGAVKPLRDEVSALRAQVHADMRATGERLARVEVAIEHLAKP